MEEVEVIEMEPPGSRVKNLKQQWIGLQDHPIYLHAVDHRGGVAKVYGPYADRDAIMFAAGFVLGWAGRDGQSAEETDVWFSGDAGPKSAGEVAQ